MIPHIAAMLLCLPATPPPDPFSTWAQRTIAAPATNPWKRDLLRNALRRGYRVETATCTAYCLRCSGWPRNETATGDRLRDGCAAADPRHWRIAPAAQRKAVVWVDDRGGRLVVLNDVGGGVRGRERLDLCGGDGPCQCSQFGRRAVRFVALRGEQ